ncbi:GNAT family N-acetyltransferase [Sinorhizobium sp. 8-89]|uniref:GNAT family N-acetyltransferase n=1 Tax=Sinorhizobium sp. 8-89 TaxID=3049089 RepID=UPI003866941C
MRSPFAWPNISKPLCAPFSHAPLFRNDEEKDTLEIRPILPEDFSELLSLCSEHAAYEGSVISESDQATHWSSAFFGAPPQLHGWVCDEGTAAPGTLRGYMTAQVAISTWSARPYVFLDCIYLKPEVRRLGIGRSMILRLIEFAREHGCREIQWQTILSNQIAKAFYSSLGAIPVTKTRWTLSAA